MGRMNSTLMRRSMLPFAKPLIRAVVLAGCVMFVNGCGIFTLATIGSVAGAAATAAQAGAEVYTLGKLHSAEMATLEQAATAVRQAGNDLSLHLKPIPAAQRDRDPSIEEFTFDDDKKTEIGVRLDARTRTLVEIHIDVGVFGSETVAHEFLMRFRAHLPHAPKSQPVPDAASARADRAGPITPESSGGV
jgi:hypothetical protein